MRWNKGFEQEMIPERWRQVKQIFQSAIERPPAERDGFISEACAPPRYAAKLNRSSLRTIKAVIPSKQSK